MCLNNHFTYTNPCNSLHNYVCSYVFSDDWPPSKYQTCEAPRTLSRTLSAVITRGAMQWRSASKPSRYIYNWLRMPPIKLTSNKTTACSPNVKQSFVHNVWSSFISQFTTSFSVMHELLWHAFSQSPALFCKYCPKVPGPYDKQLGRQSKNTSRAHQTYRSGISYALDGVNETPKWIGPQC